MCFQHINYYRTKQFWGLAERNGPMLSSPRTTLCLHPHSQYEHWSDGRWQGGGIVTSLLRNVQQLQSTAPHSTRRIVIAPPTGKWKLQIYALMYFSLQVDQIHLKTLIMLYCEAFDWTVLPWQRSKFQCFEMKKETVVTQYRQIFSKCEMFDNSSANYWIIVKAPPTVNRKKALC